MIVEEQPGRNAGLGLSCHIYDAGGAEMAGSMLRPHNSDKHSPCVVDDWNTGQPVIVVIEQPLTKLFGEHAIQLQRICLHSGLGIKPSVGDAAMRTRVHIV